MNDLEPQDELQGRLAGALAVAQRQGATLDGQALAVLKAHAEWLEEQNKVILGRKFLAEFGIHVE